ncbi:MAG: hypothetical protein ACK56W_12230 [Pirellula sp.]|jgi:hypothetical protein|nr:hypothetical protein [Pirellula sp.]
MSRSITKLAPRLNPASKQLTRWGALISCVLSSSSALISQDSITPRTGILSSITSNYQPTYYQASSNQTVVSSPATSWLSLAAKAESQLDQNLLPSIDPAKLELEQSMTNLESFLKRTPEHEANWLTFLRWNSIRKELASNDPVPADFIQFEKNFRQNFNGLELEPFTRVRNALQRYSRALLFGSNPKVSIEILGSKLKKLQELVQSPALPRDYESRHEVEQTVSFLDQTNQAKSLVQSMTSFFSLPNVRVLVSSDFVQQKFGRPVNEHNPVNENILGTQIYGNSLLQGFVVPSLVDNRHQATLRLNLNGNFSSNNIGYNRSVRLFTTGSATVAACETITLGSDGLRTLNDTGVDANLSTQINSIDAKHRIVEKIASKVAAKQKPQADAIAVGRMENRIRDQFHHQLVDQLSQSNQKLKTPSIPELVRLGLTKPNRTSWSSSQHLSLLWKVQEGVQFAATSSCPIVVQPTGITIQVHESTFSNLLDPVLAGRVLQSIDSESYASQFGELAKGGLPKDKEDDEPWAIKMSDFHPVELKLDGGLITFCIRTDKITKGADGKGVVMPAVIQASYMPVLNNNELQLARMGTVKIDFYGKQQKGAVAASLRNLLKKKFDNVFRENLLETPLRLSEKLPAELQGLSLASLHTQDGWIQAHLN